MVHNGNFTSQEFSDVCHVLSTGSWEAGGFALLFRWFCYSKMTHVNIWFMAVAAVQMNNVKCLYFNVEHRVTYHIVEAYGV